MAPHADYYAVLEVSETALPKDIKTAYRKLAFEFHPDRTQGDSKNADRMKAVNEAYAVLRDPEKRHEYNELMGLPTRTRAIKAGRSLFKEIEVNSNDANQPIAYTFNRWEPCPRCWGEGCARCQGKGKHVETVNISVTVAPGVSQVLVEGQGAQTEPGGSRGDLILYIIWTDLD